MTNDVHLPSSTKRFIDAAREVGVELDGEVRVFPEGTRTAEDAARAIGVTVGQIVKSLVFLADGAPVLCLVSGRQSTRYGAAGLGDRRCSDIARADADAVRAATGYAVGGVPPFGHPTKLSVYCDRDLTQHDVVWAAGGTPTTVFPLSPERLVEVCEARVIDLKEEA